MDLIKVIAHERVVIMVTHNPELAEKYSTRIVRLLDGEVIEDSNPLTEADEEKEVVELKKQQEENPDLAKKKKEKAKMSLWTAFKLSARNLWSKRGRTIMVGFAGSIGIIGVSLVLAVSSGIRGFIADMQEDMLSGNPITIQENAMDISALADQASDMVVEDAITILKEGHVGVNSIIKYLADQAEKMNTIMVKNEITQEYIDYLNDMNPEWLSAINYGYGIDVNNNIYTDFYEYKADYENKENAKNLSLSALKATYTSVLGQTNFKEYSSFITQLESGFKQLPAEKDYIMTQYEFLDADKMKFPENKNEVLIVVNNDEVLNDLLLAQVGYYTQEEFINIAHSTDSESGKYKEDLDKYEFSYEELMNKVFTYYPNDTVYSKTGPTDLEKLIYNSDFKYHAYSKNFTKEETNGQELKVVGIVKVKDGISYGCLSSGMYYTKDLTNYILEESAQSEIVKYMIDNEYEGIESGIIIDHKNAMNSKFYGLIYSLDCQYEGKKIPMAMGVVGSGDAASMLASLMGSMGGAGSQGGSSQAANITSVNYSLSLRSVGGNKVANSISIYAKDFDNKEFVVDYLDAWNKSHDAEITYTDVLSLVIDLINNMINIVTIALICFTAISLVVSTVMIGIITYVSVVERVKEIGVIRSLGGRKKDVSHLFNAETFIIGAVSGGLGIAVTYGVSAIANIIINHFTGVKTIADLPVNQAIIMIIVSIVLTSISGIIPASSAAKKDPVVALRTE
jgi:putative ABC transport system permease protein